jgi:hypothetical protein
LTKKETDVSFLDYKSTQHNRDFAATAPGHSAEWVADVDYVVPGSGSWDIVPNGAFDWILSSHALEHTPNLIRFFNMMSSKLKAGGLVISVLPDKRRTFDAYRPITTMGRVIDDYLNNVESPRPQAVFDQAFYGRSLNVQQSQVAHDGLNDTLVDNNNFHLALQVAREAMNSYKDAHNYVFTSTSFQLIIQHLCTNNIIGFTPVSHVHTLEGQMSFLNVMRKSS